jgi:hypothetical protein
MGICSLLTNIKIFLGEEDRKALARLDLKAPPAEKASDALAPTAPRLPLALFGRALSRTLTASALPHATGLNRQLAHLATMLRAIATGPRAEQHSFVIPECLALLRASIAK